MAHMEVNCLPHASLPEMARVDAIVLICWTGSLFPYFKALDPDTASASFPSQAWPWA